MNFAPTHNRAPAPETSKMSEPLTSGTHSVDQRDNILPFNASTSLFSPAEKNLNQAGANSVGPLSIPIAPSGPALEHFVLPEGTRFALNPNEIHPALGNRPDLHLIEVTGAQVVLSESAALVRNEHGEAILTSPAKGYVDDAEIRFPGDAHTIRFDSQFPVTVLRGAKITTETKLAA